MNGSRHGDNQLLKPPAIQVVTQSVLGSSTRESPGTYEITSIGKAAEVTERVTTTDNQMLGPMPQRAQGQKSMDGTEGGK